MIYKSVLIAIGIVCITQSASSAQTIQKAVKYTAKPIAIDGTLDQFPEESLLFTIQGQSSDNVAKFYSLWDDQFLYFRVDVQDAMLLCGGIERDSNVAWSYDGIELNFDLKNKKFLSLGDKNFRQYIIPINYNKNIYDAYGSGSAGDASFNGNTDANFRLDGNLNDDQPDKGYVALIKIPWSDFGITPKNDFVMGFDGGINDLDQIMGTPTIMDWANLKVFAQPDKWGELKLVSHPPTPDTFQLPKDKGVPVAMDMGIKIEDAPCENCSTLKSPEAGCTCTVLSYGPKVQAHGFIWLAMLGIFIYCRRKKSN